MLDKLERYKVRQAMDILFSSPWPKNSGERRPIEQYHTFVTDSSGWLTFYEKPDSLDITWHTFQLPMKRDTWERSIYGRNLCIANAVRKAGVFPFIVSSQYAPGVDLGDFTTISVPEKTYKNKIIPFMASHQKEEPLPSIEILERRVEAIFGKELRNRVSFHGIIIPKTWVDELSKVSETFRWFVYRDAKKQDLILTLAARSGLLDSFEPGPSTLYELMQGLDKHVPRKQRLDYYRRFVCKGKEITTEPSEEELIVALTNHLGITDSNREIVSKEDLESRTYKSHRCEWNEGHLLHVVNGYGICL
jgi:hypothetical protein